MHLSQGIDIQGGLIGGAILGLSSTAFLLFSGKITGLSGIAEGLVKINGDGWNWSYMMGLATSGVILLQFKPESFGASENYNKLELTQSAVIVAGLLTGMLTFTFTVLIKYTLRFTFGWQGSVHVLEAAALQVMVCVVWDVVQFDLSSQS